MNSNRFSAPRGLDRWLIGVAVGGALILALSAFADPGRAWANWLLVAYYLITLGLGGAVFLALTNVCGAGWHVAFRRVPEALTGILPFAGVVLLAALAARLPHWEHEGPHGAGPFWFKEAWLDPTFFAIRAAAIVVVWIGLARLLVANSRRQDAQMDAPRRINAAASPLFLVVFAITFSVAGFDWIMALEPMWFSTIWGVYQFSGLIMGTLATMIVACVTLRRLGPLAGVFRSDHLHDLGKLLLGFSCFWMYIWFSQYMLIWYANIPEETSYFILRTRGPWGPVVVVGLLLNWVVPLFVLLPRRCKRSETVMLRIAGVVLLGRWLDLYVMIFPPVTGATPVFGAPELAAVACLCGIAGLAFLRAFSQARPVPQNDPFLSESMHYHA